MKHGGIRLIKSRWNWLLAFLFFCSGCALASDISLSSLVQKGKHHELISELQPDFEAGKPISTYRLLLLGGSYYELRRYREANAVADRMDKNIAAGDKSYFGGDFSVYPEVFRASISLDQGAYDEAIKHGTIAYNKLNQQIFYRSQVIQIGNILGVAHAFLGHADEARKYLDIVSKVDVGWSNLGPHKYVAMSRIYMALKQYDKALESINDKNAEVAGLLTVFYDTSFQDVPKFFIRYKSYYETGKTREAKEGYDQLLKHPTIAQFGGIYWLILFDRANISLAEGDTATAIEFLKKAVEIIEQQRSSIDSEAGRIGFVGDKQAVYQQLVANLFAQQRYAEALEYVERSKSRALVDMLAKQKDFAAPAVDEAKVRELMARADQAEIDAASFAPAPQEGAPAAPRSRAGVQLARQSIAEAAPELASLVAVSATPIPDIQALLPEDEALVEYYYNDKSLFAFVLTRRGLQGARLDVSGMDADVRALRKAIQRPDSDAYLAPAQRLYARLIQPLEAIVQKPKLVIVAHGALHYLPFAALHDGNRFLIDKYSLRFLPSASVVKYLRATRLTKPAGILAFGNPDLGDAKYDLHFAQEEAVAVARTVPQSKALVRKDASESALRQYASGFQYLHFATHGEFDAESPLQSALLLAKEGAGDGLLTVGKLYSMRLDADLVTLSACETGLGKIASGDDVIGLTRGFLFAGASTVVASLWQVDDRATAELMTRFYEKLKSTDKREALRQAQFATRQKFPHPFFWAAFQLTGNAL